MPAAGDIEGEDEGAPRPNVCVMHVDVRQPGQPAGRIFEPAETWEWTERETALYGRHSVPSLVRGFRMGGDHRCGSTHPEAQDEGTRAKWWVRSKKTRPSTQSLRAPSYKLSWRRP